jgi:hypothetical protein
MTESEALKFINERIDLIKANYNDNIADYREALELSAMAIDKQIPKKITKYNVCPVCNNSQYETWYCAGSSYCEFCGQKLDWSE